MKQALLTAAFCTAAACAHQAGAGSNTLAADDPRLGAEASSICFGQTINGWRTVPGVDNALLLEQGVRNWHYVELSGPCSYRELRLTQRIALASRPAGGCIRSGDRITLLDTNDFDRTCVVRKIYEWNEGAAAEAGKETGES